MKHNKLLEVALTKTDKQSAALKQFLKRNHQPLPEDQDNEQHS